MFTYDKLQTGVQKSRDSFIIVTNLGHLLHRE